MCTFKTPLNTIYMNGIHAERTELSILIECHDAVCACMYACLTLKERSTEKHIQKN